MSDSKMDSSARIAALVPMRHNSERVPRKNYRDFAGEPLYTRIIDTLETCSCIDIVVVDTDSPIIKEGLQENFPKVKVIDRPEDLQDGKTPMNDVLLHDVDVVEAEVYLQTHSTNPLLKSKTITEAVEKFLSRYPEYDTLFSVTRLQTRLWDELARPVNHNPNILLRTQDLPPTYEENSCIYLFTRDTLVEGHNRIGDRPYLFEIDEAEAIDIDEEIDFRIAEVMYQQEVR